MAIPAYRPVHRAPVFAPSYTRPADPRGIACVGRIVKLLVGRGQGFIRLADDRDIFFHRSDVIAAAAFNDFVVGDAVTFELVEDAVSGARALRVTRR